jgi:hypothetical protein
MFGGPEQVLSAAMSAYVDCFNAGVIAGLLRGLNLPGAMAVSPVPSGSPLAGCP